MKIEDFLDDFHLKFYPAFYAKFGNKIIHIMREPCNISYETCRWGVKIYENEELLRCIFFDSEEEAKRWVERACKADVHYLLRDFSVSE